MQLTMKLLLLVKDTKFESKSQQTTEGCTERANCFYWSKIQNLKANHNYHLLWRNFQSIAFTGQRYKIWKQITTARRCFTWWLRLLLLVKDTKFESKSQPRLVKMANESYCFYWSKIQNLKANHNQCIRDIVADEIAFTGQRYKIWKQITTR